MHLTGYGEALIIKACKPYDPNVPKLLYSHSISLDNGKILKTSDLII